MPWITNNNIVLSLSVVHRKHWVWEHWYQRSVLHPPPPPTQIGEAFLRERVKTLTHKVWVYVHMRKAWALLLISAVWGWHPPFCVQWVKHCWEKPGAMAAVANPAGSGSWLFHWMSNIAFLMSSWVKLLLPTKLWLHLECHCRLPHREGRLWRVREVSWFWFNKCMGSTSVKTIFFAGCQYQEAEIRRIVL
jgi:hypothetical protein